MSDAENELLRLLVHYPLGQISAFQRKQLTTVNSPFVKVATFEGGGDDMDAPIKRMLASSLSNESSGGETKDEKQLCGVNSYNIGRPLVQMIHFVSATRLWDWMIILCNNSGLNIIFNVCYQFDRYGRTLELWKV